MEEQKRLREEIQRKKLKKIQDVSGDEARKQEEKPSRKRSRSPDKRGSRSDKSRRHHHHHRKHKRDRASSLERIAEEALRLANAAIMPPGSSVPPGVPMGVNPVASLPPMNVPPPAISMPTATSVSSVENNPTQLQQQPPHQAAPQVPVLRTVSTATIAGPMMPKIVKYQPPPDAKEKNLKAHLVVVVGNVSRLPNAFKRISLFASSVGDTKVGPKLSKCRDYCNLYKLFDFTLSFVRDVG